MVVAGLMTINWLYHALFERSRLGATPGKIVCGMKVVGKDGNRLSFVRATVRHFGKSLSTALLLGGFLLSIFRKDRRALHDLLAGAVVINSRNVQTKES